MHALTSPDAAHSADRAARHGGHCPACASQRVVRLGMRLTDGTPVVFTSCRGCGQRFWDSPEGKLDVVDVLRRTRKPGVGRVPDRALAS